MSTVLASAIPLGRDAQLNRRRVLRLVWSEPGISRVDVAQILGLNKSTVTKITNDLIGAGMVREGQTGEAGANGGRRPIGLAVDAQFGLFGGIGLGVAHADCVLIDFAGTVVASNLIGSSTGDPVDRVMAAAQWLVREAADKLLGVGIGVSGIVDAGAGILRGSIPLGVESPIAIAGPVAERLGVPVRLENDANALCWGELMDPDRPELSDFVCVFGETRPESPDLPVGVGLGFAFGGQVHHGQDYTSGEFRSPLWRDAGNSQFSIPVEVLRRVDVDPDAMDALTAEMAIGVSVLVNALDLSHVFLEGIFAHDFERHAGTLTTTLERYWPYPGRPNCRVERNRGGDHVVACGAAALLQHEYYGRVVPPFKSIASQQPLGLQEKHTATSRRERRYEVRSLR